MGFLQIYCRWWKNLSKQACKLVFANTKVTNELNIWKFNMSNIFEELLRVRESQLWTWISCRGVNINYFTFVKLFISEWSRDQCVGISQSKKNLPKCNATITRTLLDFGSPCIKHEQGTTPIKAWRVGMRAFARGRMPRRQKINFPVDVLKGPWI